MKLKIPHFLLFIYIIVFIICAINPAYRDVWWAENTPIMLIVAILIFTHPKFQFSNTAYLLMTPLIIMHTIGGHYTFANVPFDWFTNFFGFERNHYDRIAHFTVGFYAYALAEFILKTKATNKKWILVFMPIFFIMSVAAGYELFEWQFALMADPNAGAEVLGSQGDVWDAQKDILADTLGAIFSTTLFFIIRRKEIKKQL